MSSSKIIDMQRYFAAGVYLSETQNPIPSLSAKCRHLHKFTCKGTLRQVFICLRPRTPYPPPKYCSVYVYTVYLFIQGRGLGGGGELNQREGERATGLSTDHKAGLKIPTRNWLSPVYKL
jgi:hypothetical protein